MSASALRVMIASSWLLMATQPLSAATIPCDTLKPEQPVDTQLQNKFGAHVGGWLKQLPTISVDDEYKKITKEQKFKDPDEANLHRSFLYLFCLMIDKSTLPDKEKFDRFGDLERQLLPPNESSTGGIRNNLVVGNKSGGIRAPKGVPIENNQVIQNGGKGIDVVPDAPTRSPDQK